MDKLSRNIVIETAVNAHIKVLSDRGYNDESLQTPGQMADFQAKLQSALIILSEMGETTGEIQRFRKVLSYMPEDHPGAANLLIAYDWLHEDNTLAVASLAAFRGSLHVSFGTGDELKRIPRLSQVMSALNLKERNRKMLDPVRQKKIGRSQRLPRS